MSPDQPKTGLESILSELASQNTQPSININDGIVNSNPPVVSNPVNEPAPTAQTEVVPAKSETTSVQTTSPEKGQESLSVIDDWDFEPVSTAPTPSTPTFDFGTIGKDLGYDFKTQDEVVNELKRFKEQERIYQEKASQQPENPFANDTLKAANEIARNNGNYLDYLGLASINYDAISNRDLLQDDLINQFGSTPENVTQIEDYINGLSEMEMNIKGNQIRQVYKMEQEQQKNLMVRQAQEAQLTAQKEKLEMDRRVKSTLDSVTDINGFVLKPSHKEAIYSDITTGKLYDKLFFTNGVFDPSKAIKALFIIENNDKINQYHKTRYKTEGKRDIINAITNAELDRPSSPAINSQEGKSGLDSYLESLKARR